METSAVEADTKTNKTTSKDTQLKCTDVARVLQQTFLNHKSKRTPHFGYSYPGVQPGQKVRYEFINMVGASTNAPATGDSQSSLPPLYNYNNSLVRETTWSRFRSNRDERKDSGQTPKLTYNHGSHEKTVEESNRSSPDRRRKDRKSNKENRVVNAKFLEYINKKRELTRQLHVDCNHLNIAERPGNSPTNQPPQIAVKREHSTMRDKIADFRRWREKENTVLNVMSSANGVPEFKREKIPEFKREKTEMPRHSNLPTAPNNVSLVRQNTTAAAVQTKPARQELQDVRLLRKTLKDHDQRMDSRDSARRSKASKESKETPPPLPKYTRQGSAGTWHTWRDMNQSDAYTDVKKYIDENDLMSPSKDARIRRWVHDVDKHMPGIMDSGELPITPLADERLSSTDGTSTVSSRT